MDVPANPTPLQWYLSPWKRYASFEGRSGRAEYWWFFLGQVLIGALLSVLGELAAVFDALFFLVLLASLVPSIAVNARRLHDIGQSGWLQLIALFPILGGLALLVLNALPSQPRPNQYGDAPLPPAP